MGSDQSVAHRHVAHQERTDEDARRKREWVHGERMQSDNMHADVWEKKEAVPHPGIRDFVVRQPQDLLETHTLQHRA